MKTQSIINFLESFEGNYEEVKELTINRFDITGDMASVDLTELLNFSNLENLTLINLILDNKEIAILTKIPNLFKLSLINCEIICSYIPTDLLKIKNIILDNSNFEEYINNAILDYVEIKNMNIGYQQIKTNTLKIDKANIDFEKINFNNIKHLIISEKQFNINKDLLLSKTLNIKLTIKDNGYDKVVKEYEKI